MNVRLNTANKNVNRKFENDVEIQTFDFFRKHDGENFVF